MSETEWAAVDTVVCDIDGVVVLGSQPIAGVGEALNRLHQAGIELVFVTNNSTKTRATIAKRVSEIVGFVVPVANVINSGWVTGCHVGGQADRVYVVGSQGLRDTLRETGVGITEAWREADAVVVGLDFQLTFSALRDAALAVQHGAKFYATNDDPSYPTGEGQYPGAGALVAAVATTTGHDPVVCGKPYEPMQRLLASRVGELPLMVGDRPETDIALGKAMDWATALVLTGVTASATDVPVAYRPDLVMESLADLPGRLGL